MVEVLLFGLFLRKPVRAGLHDDFVGILDGHFVRPEDVYKFVTSKVGKVVKAFLRVCSNARNLRMDRFTDG